MAGISQIIFFQGVGGQIIKLKLIGHRPDFRHGDAERTLDPRPDPSFRAKLRLYIVHRVGIAPKLGVVEVSGILPDLLAQQVSVVRSEDHDGVVVEPRMLETGQDSHDLLVGVELNRKLGRLEACIAFMPPDPAGCRFIPSVPDGEGCEYR